MELQQEQQQQVVPAAAAPKKKPAASRKKQASQQQPVAVYAAVGACCASSSKVCCGEADSAPVVGSTPLPPLLPVVEPIIMHLNITGDEELDVPTAYDGSQQELSSFAPACCSISSTPLVDDASAASGASGCTDPLSSGPGSDRPRVLDILKDFAERSKTHEWPSNTSCACYWCVHPFGTQPYGLPVRYNAADGRFHVFGCFCSLECATAYNFKDDTCSMYERWERYSLINALAHRIGYHLSPSPPQQQDEGVVAAAAPARSGKVVPAPPRLALQMFGGHLSIEEFRGLGAVGGRVVNVSFPPMVALTQQIEEVNESDAMKDVRFIPLDTERVQKYKERWTLRRTKPVNAHATTLDKTMKIQLSSSSTSRQQQPKPL